MYFALLTLSVFLIDSADAPLRSGPQPKQRPGPYSSLVSVGPQRGTQHCYICEAADRPTIIVFARTLNEPLGKLALQLDRAVQKHKDIELRSWVTILADDQPALDPKVVAWAKEHALSQLPVGVFEDVQGPPSYLLHKDAEVTVLLAIGQKVAANFAYRAGELNDREVERIVQAMPMILRTKK